MCLIFPLLIFICIFYSPLFHFKLLKYRNIVINFCLMVSSLWIYFSIFKTKFFAWVAWSLAQQQTHLLVCFIMWGHEGFYVVLASFSSWSLITLTLASVWSSTLLADSHPGNHIYPSTYKSHWQKTGAVSIFQHDYFTNVSCVLSYPGLNIDSKNDPSSWLHWPCFMGC